MNHIEDYGFLRYEMGYAAAISVVLLLIVQLFSKGANALLTEKDPYGKAKATKNKIVKELKMPDERRA